jgi:hypothetical protein
MPFDTREMTILTLCSGTRATLATTGLFLSVLRELCASHLQITHHAPDTVLHQLHNEIDQKSKSQVLKPQLRQADHSLLDQTA